MSKQFNNEGTVIGLQRGPKSVILTVEVFYPLDNGDILI